MKTLDNANALKEVHSSTETQVLQHWAVCSSRMHAFLAHGDGILAKPLLNVLDITHRYQLNRLLNIDVHVHSDVYRSVPKRWSCSKE